MSKQEFISLNSIPYSVLDLSPIIQGGSAAVTFQNTVDLAKHVENWGYKRYWLAEHHNMPGIGSSATSILIGHVAANTSTIRVGSGGIMLPNHAPLVIAEQFGTLESLFPGRIDLGIGRAPGTDQLTAYALRRDRRNDGQDFPELLTELRAYFQDRQSTKSKVRAIPGQGLQVPIWLLGSSGYSAQLAGQLGLPFAFASHFAPENTLPALALYRNSFRPSNVLDKPYALVAMNIIAADNDDEALLLSTSLQQQHLHLLRNNPILLQPPVDNMDELCSDFEKAILQQKLSRSIIGSPSTIKKKLTKFSQETRANEIIVNSQIYDHQARLHSFKIIADIMNESN